MPCRFFCPMIDSDYWRYKLVLVAEYASGDWVLSDCALLEVDSICGW